MCDFELNFFLADQLRLKNAILFCQKAAGYAEKINARIESDASAFERDLKIPDELNGLYTNVQRAALILYEAGLHRPSSPDRGENQILQGQNFSGEKCSVAEENRVVARANRAGIFVRTPLLWTKNGREKRDSNGASKSENVLFFKSEIMKSLSDQMICPDFSPADFEEKIIFFLYVYPTSLRTPPPDNDNHETKYILDAIALSTPGGDSALCTTIISSAVCTDEIPTGTYVSLTEAKRGMPSKKGIIALWRYMLRK